MFVILELETCSGVLVYNWLPLPSFSLSSITYTSVPSTDQFTVLQGCSRCLSAFRLRVVVHYVSSTAEDTDFCSLGAGLHRLSALHQEDVDGQVREKSTRPFTVHEHGERG